MAVKYYRKRIKVNINGKSVYKYVADMQKEEVITLERIAEVVEKKSTLSKGDLVNAFYQMLDIAEFYMLDGHKIDFGVFGSFSPSIRATACDTPDEITTKTIKRFYPIYKPTMSLKKKFMKTEFRLGDNKVREVRYERKKE